MLQLHYKCHLCSKWNVRPNVKLSNHVQTTYYLKLPKIFQAPADSETGPSVLPAGKPKNRSNPDPNHEWSLSKRERWGRFCVHDLRFTRDVRLKRVNVSFLRDVIFRIVVLPVALQAWTCDVVECIILFWGWMT